MNIPGQVFRNSCSITDRRTVVAMMFFDKISIYICVCTLYYIYILDLKT